MVADWEFSYLDLTFGADNDFQVTKVEGLDPPDSRVDLDVNEEDHGAFVYAAFLDHREITFEGDMVSTDAETFEALVDDFRETFAPRTDPEPLYMKRPGQVAQRIECVPTRRHFPVDVEYGLFSMKYALQFVAGDPRIYSEELYAVTLTPFVELGIDFPIEFSTDFGGGTGAQGNAVNDGSFPTHPTTRIDGPITNPKVSNVDQGKHLEVDMVVENGQYLIIDHLAKTVMLGGTASRYSQLTDDSEWWTLDPGSNTVRFDGSGEGGATQVTISWRSAWL